MLITYFVAIVVSSAVLLIVEDELQDPELNLSTAALIFWGATTSIVTVGLGAVMPTGNSSFAVMAIQQFLGLLLQSVIFSVLVAKLMQAHPDLIFSRRVLITTRDGAPCLLFRIGNRRCNLLLQPDIRVGLNVPRNTKEGETYIERKDIDVVVPGAISAACTIAHYITEGSPLAGLTAATLDPDVTLSVVLSAYDTVLQNSVCSIQKYTSADFDFGNHLFCDIFKQVGDQDDLDFRQFDQLRNTEIVLDAPVPEAFATSADPSAPPPWQAGTLRLYVDAWWDGGTLRNACSLGMHLHAILKEIGAPFEEVLVDYDLEHPDWLPPEIKGQKLPAARMPDGSIVVGYGKIAEAIYSTFPELSAPLRARQCNNPDLDPTWVLQVGLKPYYKFCSTPPPGSHDSSSLSRLPMILQSCAEKHEMESGAKQTSTSASDLKEVFNSLVAGFKPVRDALSDGRLFLCSSASQPSHDQAPGSLDFLLCFVLTTIGEIVQHWYGLDFFAEAPDLRPWLRRVIAYPAVAGTYPRNYTALLGYYARCLSGGFPHFRSIPSTVVAAMERQRHLTPPGTRTAYLCWTKGMIAGGARRRQLSRVASFCH